MRESYREQDTETVFALDIGTCSIIGVVGRAENGCLHVIAVEKEEYSRRAMLDGQIEDIDQVAQTAGAVVSRLEEQLETSLKRVCAAAAGRALKSQSAGFAMEFPESRLIDDDIIGQLEAGAVSAAESMLSDGADQHGLFYMVGYSASQFRLDSYPMSTIREHRGKKVEVEVVATFLPREVVESLYAVVSQLGLEAASLTLEPIASLNAAIPPDIRLLNLALVDVGAGTSDIAVCRDGSVSGYTMATVAGDEVTEHLMRELLVDFKTGEQLKISAEAEGPFSYLDVLGVGHEISAVQLQELMEPAVEELGKEIAGRILEVNGTAPSAVFLAGGGSKLRGLSACVAEQLKMNAARVALAGNHFEKSICADGLDLNDPEYSTPLGIAVSAALGMINDSYVITLNGNRAKLFRSGALTIRDILLMNGFHYGDMMGRTGANLVVTLNGKRRFFRGTPSQSAGILLNGLEASLSDRVHAGDSIQFTPAAPGEAATRTLKELLQEEQVAGEASVNGRMVSPEYSLLTGDMIEISSFPREDPSVMEKAETQTCLSVILNGKPVRLSPKASGEPYYLMDILEYCGLDFAHLEKPVELLVNSQQGQFSQRLAHNDQVVIRCIAE